MRWLRTLHESLDGARMKGPFFVVSGYFLAAAAAAFMLIVFGLFLDKSVARPAFFAVAACLVIMIADAIRATLTRR